jgi:hypothetical protein
MGILDAVLAYWYAYLSQDAVLAAAATAAGWNGTSPWILMPQQRYVATYPSIVIGFDGGRSRPQGDDYSASKWANGTLTNEICCKMGDVDLDPITSVIQIQARLRQLLLGDPALELLPLVGTAISSQYNITECDIMGERWLPATDNTYQRYLLPCHLQVNDYTL